MKLIRIFIFIVFCSACTFAGLANWVNNRPSSSRAYIGIGMATKSEFNSKEEWIKAAESRALNSISSSISISIENSAVLSLRATEKSHSEEYREDLRSFTKMNIEGYEYVDNCENRKEYWVYLRLDKKIWRQIEKRRLKEGTAKATAYIKSGKQFEKNGQTLSAIHSYIQAFREVVPVLYLNPQIIYNSTKIPLLTYIDECMISILNSIEFSIANPLYRGTRSSFKNSELTFSLMSKIAPVSSFPLIIRDKKYISDAQGKVTISSSVIGKKSDNIIMLPITTDLKGIFPAKGSPLMHQWLSQKKWPFMTTQIIFDKPKVYIESLGAGYEELPYKQLENELKKQLNDFGYKSTEFAEDAEYHIIVKSSTRPAGAMGNLYFTYMDVKWILYDKSGDLLFREELTAVKEGASSYAVAGLKAYSKGSTILTERIINWLKENR